MNSILELRAISTLLKESLNFFQVADLAMFESLRIVNYESRVLRRSDLIIDVADSMFSMGNGLFHSWVSVFETKECSDLTL